jgi:hypothetical protein
MVVPGEAGDIVAVRTATTPSCMTFASSPPEFRPVRKQVYTPGVPAQARDLPAAVADAPAAAEIAMTSEGE